MHEASLAQSLLTTIKQVAQEHALQKITAIYITVGEISGVDAQSLDFALKAIQENSIIDSAQIIIKTQPITIQCRHCSFGGEIAKYQFACPECHTPDINLIKGKEFILTNIEGE